VTGTPRPCYRSISIVADGRLAVCDGAHSLFVMKKGSGQIARVDMVEDAVIWEDWRTLASPRFFSSSF
jgi:hypothetical protein